MEIEIGSDFSGVGAFIQALERLGISHNEVFACDMDKFARKTYCLNYGNEADIALSETKEHDKLCDLIFKYTMKGEKLPQKIADEAEEMAKRFSFYYPFDVYKRNIPENPVDLYVTSPPCQGFSMAGLREGSILFLNSHEFIKKKKPRYFIFENVKGLLSHERNKNNKKQPYGYTFQQWVGYLGGKSVNGNPTFFPHEESVPYHIHFTVMNAKEFGVPQNRERVFIVGIRDDEDNNFTFPKPVTLTKKLKDVLEENVDSKYFLSEKMIQGFKKHAEIHAEKGNGFSFSVSDVNREARSVTTNSGSRNTDNFIEEENVLLIKIKTEKKNFIAENGISGTVMENNRSNGGVIVTRQLTGGKWDKTHEQSGRVYSKEGLSPTIHTMQGGNQEPKTEEGIRIRRLTPTECFRLMDFNESFKWNVSDSQAYKQAGNSIVVQCLVEIIKKLNFN